MRTKRKPDWENLLSVLEPQINAEGLHVWPFDASFPIDVRSFELAEPNNLRMNRHEYFEFTYIRSGQAVFQIQDRFFDVREGDLVVIGSTLYHRVTSCSRLPAKIIVLYFLPELVRGAAVAGDDVEYMMPFLIQDADFPHVIKSATGIPAQALDLMEKMRAEFPPRTVRSRLAVKTYLKMALMLIVNHYFDYSGAKQAFDRRMRAIARLRPLFEHLESHYDQPVTIEDAAETCAMSTSYFMRFLKAATGQSFLSYLNHFRIEKAQALLASTDKSISEISQAIGFCDQSYFGVVFRRLVGMTPLAYRRRFGRMNSEVPCQSQGPQKSARSSKASHRSDTQEITHTP